MITVNRRSYIEGAIPEDVFATLSDPHGLTRLLPRIRKAELLDMKASSARLVTHMALGGIFGTIRCEGDLLWRAPRDILFRVRTPLTLETRWTLVPAVNGTDLQASMSLDLAPLLGPMAQFVPTDSVGDVLGNELASALQAITKRCRGMSLLERVAA